MPQAIMPICSLLSRCFLVVLCLLALSTAADAPRTLALDRFAERIQDYTQGRDVISGTTIALDDTLEVPAQTPLVLELMR